MYFQLNPHCYLVRGAVYDAIYDILQERVFWLHRRDFGQIVRQLTDGAELGEVVRSVGIPEKDARGMLEMLAMLDYGQYHVGPVYPEKFHPTILPGQEENFFVLRPFNQVVLEVTGDCSYECSACDAGQNLCTTHCACGRWDPDDEVASMDTSVVIKDLAVYGCKEIIVKGGDPFLAPSALRKIVKEAGAWGLPVTVQAPCSPLLLDHLPYIEENNIRILLPVFGFDADSYERETGQEGSFSALLELCKWHGEKRSIDIGAIIIAADETIPRIDKIRNLLEDQNIPVAMQAFRVTTPAREKRSRKERWPALYKRSYKDCKVTLDAFFRLVKGHFCWQDSIAVSRSGGILPCIAARRHQIGDLKKESVYDVIREKRHHNYRDLSNSVATPCNRCEFRYGCISCSLSSEAHAGSMQTKSWTCLYDPDRGEWRADPEWPIHKYDGIRPPIHPA